ncbi:GAP family protein [Protaetiibacter sp. SSC-01]|uniref:GAP family protein n=1 Tax=Protaetiibacter sp. SSC-01 TaxID=2759943 RepID=UPI001656AB81|nr:GAP family protein [Protaetiibacter sp. SSC-01]QNO36931.1 GAP family protein [Protaetiibacter sp. SSC-01]
MDVLGVLLPLALGVALSTVPITVVLALLLSPRGQAVGVAYLVGYALGLALVTVGFTAGLRAIPRGDAQLPDVVVGTGEILIGLVGVWFAVWVFRRGRRRTTGDDIDPEVPGWLRRVGRMKASTAFLVGLGLNVRPKALVLATAAALAFNAGELTPLVWAVGTAVYLAIGLSTVAAPVIVVWRSGERARPTLRRAHAWVSRNSYVVTAVVVIMVAVVLIGDGLSRL